MLSTTIPDISLGLPDSPNLSPWKHRKAEVRRDAIRKRSDQTLLAEVAKTDLLASVRVLAIEKLSIGVICQNQKMIRATMMKITPLFFLFVCLFFSCFVVTAVAQPIVEGDFEIRVEQNHPWRPPFGLDRIGGPITLTITQNGHRLPARGFHLDSYRHGKIIQQDVIQFPEQVPKVVRKELHAWPDEIVLWPAGSVGKETETFRQKIQPPGFEAEAMARPETTLHPVYSLG